MDGIWGRSVGDFGGRDGRGGEGREGEEMDAQGRAKVSPGARVRWEDLPGIHCTICLPHHGFFSFSFHFIFV